MKNERMRNILLGFIDHDIAMLNGWSNSRELIETEKQYLEDLWEIRGAIDNVLPSPSSLDYFVRYTTRGPEETVTPILVEIRRQIDEAEERKKNVR